MAAYAEKCRQQDRAVTAAQRELLQLQKKMRSMAKTPQSNESNIVGDMQRDLEQMKLLLEEEKLRLNKDLVAERARCIEYENRCVMLERKIKKLEASGAVDRTSTSTSTSTSLYDILQVRKKIWEGVVQSSHLDCLLTRASHRSVLYKSHLRFSLL